MGSVGTIPRGSIQRKMLTVVLPLIVVPLLVIGLVSFFTSKEEAANRSRRFLQDRHNEILTIGENQSVASYFHNIAYGLSEEATMYKEELERFFKKFSDRYNSIEQICAGVRYINEEGQEVAKISDGKVVGEYRNVVDEEFFQVSIASPPGTVHTSPVHPRMVNAMPIFWDEDGNGEFSEDELRGVIAVDFLYPIREFRHAQVVMALATIGIALLSIIVAVTTVTVRLRRVTRPINDLVGATKAIASGDLTTEIAVQSEEDEVGLLATSFNQMARDLRRNIDEKDGYARELRQLNVELEDKVKERTMELEVANEGFQQANLKIREADRLKSEFLANMSHELRTPMNAIIGFTRLVLRRSAKVLPSKQRENLEKVEISANQLLSLINDILDLSKIEAGKMTVSITPFELTSLVDVCFATVEPMVRRERVSLVKEVPGDLPEVVTDQDKLKQIIINLLSNALKFTEEGEVKLSTAVEDATLRVAVSDTGIGMSSHALQYIFDEFRQVDGSSTRRHGGTGLGLSITQKLTQLLGGSIDVSSIEGEGSTFTITLPLGRREDTVAAEVVAWDQETLAEAGVRGKKVLLAIDDDPNVLLLLRGNLEEEGYYVVGALSGEDGIRKAREIEPFAITLDILMPHKDGWEVLNDLKADPATRDIPIIVLSIVDDRALGFSLGAFDYLVKPFEKDAIVAALQRIPGAATNRVLVVDDEPDAVDLITQLLQDEGYQVTGVYSGEEALRVLEAEPPDIILLDLLMPGMDGFEVIQQVKANQSWKDIPIVVVTAKDLTDADGEFLRRSVDKIIRKSGLDRETLVREVQRLLREHVASRGEGSANEESPGS